MRKLLVYGALAFTLCVSACSQTGQGALIGGGLGGLGGLAVGSAVDHPVAGTLIGGALGALGGAAVGHATSHRR
jgi:osmotically inducible lipoprotein OsmB